LSIEYILHKNDHHLDIINHLAHIEY